MTGNSALQELFDACGTAELVADGVRMSSTALHHGANDWSRALRRAGIARGDRVVCALPKGPAFVQLLVAALADGVTLAPVPPTEDVVPLLDALDASIAIALHAAHPNVAVPSHTGGPPGGSITARRTIERTENVAFLLRSSGTTGTPRWIGVPETGVLSVLESHLPQMALDGGSALCLLPWHHAFGLVLGVMAALLRARRVVTAAEPPRDAAAMVALAQAHAVSHLSMVPLTAHRLAGSSDGMTLLRALNGGLVGGAPIDAALAAHLTATRLRVGYGQTEASPGIMLGQPGEFAAGFIGRPVGCEVRIENDGVLAFRGLNACSGIWQDGAMQALDPQRWHRTDDIVAMHAGAYTFLSRASLSFKLANGTLVVPPALEHTIRQQVPRITDLVLSPTPQQLIAVTYSTRDDVDIDQHEIQRALGGLCAYVGVTRRVPSGAWQRTVKGEIDRRILPPLS
ncbi:MAG: class I adenylate-forming enzyme family protein [Gemmatimonadota bacterium]